MRTLSLEDGLIYCQRCGASMSPSVGSCPLCKAPRLVQTATTTGTLTPVPGADDATQYIPATPSADPDATYFIAPGAVSGNGSRPADDSTGLPTGPGLPTGFSSAEASTVFGDPTVKGIGVRQTAAMREAEGPLHVGQQFSARYIIVRLLGIGGMGAVYQAWDPELSVMVAVKVVPSARAWMSVARTSADASVP